MTKIPWCDETVNLVAGCSKVSPGCDHCYALGMARRGYCGLAWKPEVEE